MDVSWSGLTQASAVLLTELARPTTVSAGSPGSSGNLRWAPTPNPHPPPAVFITIWPGPVAQVPDMSTTSSTDPPGDERPTTVICPIGRPEGIPVPEPATGCSDAVAYGPAAAVTPGA